jgi:hypothetical protein
MISEKSEGGVMGGHGSGRWGVSRRPLAESMRRIDLARLMRDHPGITDNHALKVHFGAAKNHR